MTIKPEKVLKKHTLEEILQEAKELLHFIDEKKGINPIMLDVSRQISFTDVFVIASGQSFIHLKSLEQYCEEFLKKKGYIKNNPRDQIPENPWILLDFHDIIIHLFTEEAREFYHLEKLWFDAPKITLNETQT